MISSRLNLAAAARSICSGRFRGVLFFLFAVLIVVTPDAFGGPAATSRRIVIGGDRNYSPYEYLDENGRPAGCNVDLTRAIAREMGLDIEIRLDDWAAIKGGLSRGEIDAIQGMFYSPERDLAFDFSPPYTVINHVAVVRRDAGKPPETLSELAGRRLVVMKGDIMHDFAVNKGYTDLITTVPTQEAALRELAQGRCDCALVARIPALFWIKKNGWDNLIAGQHSFLSAEYCYAVPNNRGVFLAQLSEGLKVVKETGEYRSIYNKWLGVYEKRPAGVFDFIRYAAIVVIPLLVALLVFFLWSGSLRKQVAARTAELSEREAFLGMLIDAIPISVFYKDRDGRYLGFNKAFEAFFGVTRERLIGKTAFDVNPAELAEIYHANDNELLATEGAQQYEAQVKNAKCELREVIFNKAVFTDAQGIVSGQIGAVLDITERKRTERRIEHLNKVLRAIRDVNQLIVRERDPEALIQKVCRLLVDNRGYAAALIVLTDENGRPASWVGSGIAESSESLNDMLERFELPPCCACAIAEEKVVVIDNRQEVCDRCSIVEGCAETCAVCVQLIHNGSAFGYLIAALSLDLKIHEEELSLIAEMAGDIAYALNFLRMDRAHESSERQREALENQLRQAQKMESVGRLAGGVAHDYNNMLSIIIGYVELALEKVDLGNSLHDDLLEIFAAAKRSADITRQLLAFARQQTVAPEVLHINDTLEGMMNMLRRLIGEDVNLAWLPGPKLWPVKIDPSQVDQVLANLCVNARDAIVDVGKVTIETKNISFDEEYCIDHAGFVPGDYVLLAVSDDGCGIAPDALDKIFEPFFTTKGAGKGTGLGLATVYGIVKQNNGFINVYSEPGKGTTIRVYLSRYAGPAATAHRESTGEKIPVSRGETVLLVEDDGSILKLGKKILVGLGYTVLSASTPGEAKLLAANYKGEINLLITDVVMPEMNGRELSERLERLYPKLKTLFMSGYTANVIAHRGVLEDGVCFIPKPFSKKDLALKVRAALADA